MLLNILTYIGQSSTTEKCVCVCVHVHSVVSDSLDPMDCSLPGWNFPGKNTGLELVVISFSRGSSPPRVQTVSPTLAGGLIPLHHLGSPQQRTIWLKMSIVLKLRNHGLIALQPARVSLLKQMCWAYYSPFQLFTLLPG